MSTKAIWKSKSRLFYAQWNAVKHSTSLVCRNGLSMRYSLTCSIWPCFSCCHSHAYTERYKYHNTLALLYIYSYGLSSLFVMCSCVVPDQCVVTKYHKKKTCDILTDMLKQQTHLKMGLTQNDWNCPQKKKADFSFPVTNAHAYWTEQILLFNSNKSPVLPLLSPADSFIS